MCNDSLLLQTSYIKQTNPKSRSFFPNPNLIVAEPLNHINKAHSIEIAEENNYNTRSLQNQQNGKTEEVVRAKRES